MNSPKPSPGNNRILLKYAGLTMQVMVALALGVFAGLKLDKWLSFKTPILVWVLPLLIIIAMIWQIIKDTSKKN
jgi:membrane protein DedA with SNARE-associated domain